MGTTSLAELAPLLWTRVFVFIAVGCALGKIWPRSVQPWIRRFVALSIYVVVPVFILMVMWRGMASAAHWGRLGAAVLGVLAGSAALAWFLSRLWKEAYRNLCLPVVFMNSIYLALPVNFLLYREPGAAATVVINLIVTAVHFTLGIWWVRRKDKAWWSEIFGLPILYAAVAGALLNFWGVPCPAPAARFLTGLSLVALPVMLILVGIRMAGVSVGAWKNVGLGVLARMGGGTFLGWLLAEALNLRGIERGALILTASMPSAVNTYILAEKFDCNPSFAAAMVTLGTALSAITVPILGWVLK